MNRTVLVSDECKSLEHWEPMPGVYLDVRCYPDRASVLNKLNEMFPPGHFDALRGKYPHLFESVDRSETE